MSLWDRVIAFSSASPFTGTWMSLGTALGCLLLVLALRRFLPDEDRHHGRVTASLLVLGLMLGCVRLVVVAAGAGGSGAGRALAVFTPFFVAQGAMGALVMALFEVLPLRLGVRFPTLLRDLIGLIAVGLVLVGVLSRRGIDVVPMITTAGVTAAVIGFALQSTIANLFSGIVLNTDRALGVGDWVQVGQRTGRIQQIRWRSTVLRTADGDTVIIPNSQLTTQEVYNYSRPSTRHRHWIKQPFHARHPPNDVRKVLVEAARGAPGVLADPGPDAFPIEVSDGAVIYALRIWIDDYARKNDVEGEVRTRVWYAAKRAGFEIPSSNRTIYVRQAGEEKRRNTTDSEVAQRAVALERTELFAPLAATDRDILARAMKEVRFGMGETIIRQSEAGDSMFLIARGEVRVTLGEGALQTAVASLGPGQFFGEMSLITGEPRAATCVAATDVACYVIDHPGFQTLLTMRPHVADQLSATLTARQATLDQKGTELSSRAAHAADARSKLLERIRSFFDPGDPGNLGNPG